MEQISVVMEPKTLEALRESIAHWDRLASGNRKPGEMTGVDHCALCALFWTWDKKVDKPSCVGCPVMARTGKKFCTGSPYEAAMEVIEDLEDNGVPDDETLDHPDFKAAAMRELEFLRSLLPEDHLTK